jgi:hypothetical protein
LPERRFPPPCSVDEVDSKLYRRSFIVRDVVGRRSLTSISRRSRDGARQPSCSPRTEPGASPPTSPSHSKQGPIQFLKNNPIQSSFWVRFHVPQDKEKLASPSNCKIPSGVQLPPAAALRRSHTRGRRPPPFHAIHALDRYSGRDGDFVLV